MNNISHPHTPRELIIRAEIPELGIRKAIRVMNTDTARQVLDQLSGKANLSADFVSQCRLYKTVGAASTGAASGNSTEKQHLAVDRHFGVANESAAYECEALPWDYADWQDHSDILIKRWQPHSSKSAPASRSNSLRQQANGACNSALPPSTALLHTITPTQNTGGRSHALEDSVVTLLSDTKKITMKGIGRIAQSLNPHSHASSQKKAVELKPTPVCPMPSFVFGVELDRVPADSNTGLPYVVEKLLAFIEQTGTL